MMLTEQFVSLSDQEYQQIARLIYRKFGITLGEKKRSLVAGRLHSVLRRLGLQTFDEFYRQVLRDRTGKSLSLLVDRISTNHTYFYREKDHFDYLAETVFPEIRHAQNGRSTKELRIWSAGCSSGEEPYTIAMLMMDFWGEELSNWNAGILGTDISENMLSNARAGIYSEENVAQLPPSLKHRYFRKTVDKNWQIIPELRERVLFRRLNLIRDEYPFRRQFHVIFCRNVMIYFDKTNREKLIANFHRHLVPGGYLFLGHSESISRNNPLFRYIRPAVYRKKGSLS